MRNRQTQDEEQPVDAVALTLAVWLGLIVGVTGLMRLSENAARQAALAQDRARPATHATTQVAGPFDAGMMAFGG